MMDQLIKNVEKSVSLSLKDQIDYETGRVVSKTLAQRPESGITLMAFDAGEGISTHAATGDAMAYILEGTASITIGGVEHTVSQGNCIVMPVDVPHGVKAVTQFKMMLILIR